MVSEQLFDHKGNSWLETRTWQELSMTSIWALIWAAVNLQFLRLLTRMNVSSAAKVTLGLPFLEWWASFILPYNRFYQLSNRAVNCVSAWLLHSTVDLPSPIKKASVSKLLTSIDLFLTRYTTLTLALNACYIQPQLLNKTVITPSDAS